MLGGFSRRPSPSTPETQNPSAPDPRTALRQAQATHTAAVHFAHTATAAAARGLAAVDAARAKVAPYADVDARVAEHQAAQLRAGDAAGPAGLPPGLVQARRARAAALELVADAEAAHHLLANEAQEATVAADAAEITVRAAAVLVMHQIARALAARLREHEAEAGRLRSLVGGLLMNRIPADAVPEWEITRLLQDPQHAALVDAAGPAWRTAGAAWQGLRVALMRDADAQLP